LSQRVLYHTQEIGLNLQFGVLVLLTARCARLEEMMFVELGRVDCTMTRLEIDYPKGDVEGI